MSAMYLKVGSMKSLEEAPGLPSDCVAQGAGLAAAESFADCEHGLCPVQDLASRRLGLSMTPHQNATEALRNIALMGQAAIWHPM